MDHLSRVKVVIFVVIIAMLMMLMFVLVMVGFLIIIDVLHVDWLFLWIVIDGYNRGILLV